MLLSLLLAWLAVLCTVFTVFKFLARISGNRKLNRFFARHHIPFGLLLLLFGLLHGVLAGNMSTATLQNFTFAPVLFTLNWGTACLVLAIALALTYVFRKKLKKRWMPAHRVLTVLLAVCLTLHLLNTGIQIFDRLASQTRSAAEESTETSETGGDQNETVTSEETQTTAPAVSFSGAVLTDGTYQGSADGYNGTITVSVTVSGGQVTDIAVVSNSDTARFFDSATGVLTDIEEEQSLEVDTVTGATFSSAGLIQATYNALQNAVISGTLQVNSVDLSAIRRH